MLIDAVLVKVDDEQVANRLAFGATGREVAERLVLSVHTVNSHLRHVFAKLGIRSRGELARLAGAPGEITRDGVLALDVPDVLGQLHDSSPGLGTA